MEIILLWLALCLVVEFIAQKRGHTSGHYFLLSLILSPIIGLIVAVAAPSKSK